MHVINPQRLGKYFMHEIYPQKLGKYSMHVINPQKLGKTNLFKLCLHAYNSRKQEKNYLQAFLPLREVFHKKCLR